MNKTKNNLTIKFTYRKMLSQKRNFKEAKIILEELIGTRNENYAKLEVGRTQYAKGEFDKAKKNYT